MISAGFLKYRGKIYRESSFDNLGVRQTTFTWTGGYFRCSLEETGASEQLYGGTTYMVKSYTVKVRWDTLDGVLEPTDRIQVKDKMLKIKSISNMSEKDRVMEIECEEVV